MMHPTLHAIIAHRVHVLCTLANSPSTLSLTRCTLDAPNLITIITHKVHIGCTLAVSQCTCHAPHTCYAWAERVPCAHALCATCMSRMCHVRTQHMLRAPRTCYARVMHVPCICHAPRTYLHVRCICHEPTTRRALARAHAMHMHRMCRAHIARHTHTPRMCYVQFVPCTHPAPHK